MVSRNLLSIPFALSTGLVLMLLPAPSFPAPVGTSAGQARSLGRDLMERRRRDEPFTPGSGPETKPEFQLPPVTPAPAERLSSGLGIFVRKFHLRGGTVFPAGTLERLAAPHENRFLTTQGCSRYTWI